VVGLSRDTLWYDYGFREPQGPVPRESYQKRVLKKAIFRAAKRVIGDSPPVCSSQYVVLVSRQNTRLILNEEEVVSVLTEETNLPVIRIRMEGFNRLKEMASKVRCAQMLVGVHGSALALAMFLSRGAALVELFPYAIDPRDYTPYKTLAESLALVYSSWSNSNPNNTFPHPEYPPLLGGIAHLPLQEQRDILESNSVPPHLCCTSPLWLFRVYQDTVVDTFSFRQTLQATIQRKNDLQDMNLDAGLETPLKPGPVRSVKCSRSKEGHEASETVTLSWSSPWNLKYFQKPSVNYEILLKEDGTNTAQARFSRGTQLTLNPGHGKPLTIWIRCHLNAEKGPFPTEPTRC
jgi:protein O-mannose beta-1,4-N-acetylglucosaminyltransferase